ncbi:MAG: aminotransferase class V-fold PLP-dependent enzyme [Oscillatoriales cyanobacterium SM2_2_1]|nr:aminotransferase class V-fold PLP-dependent enzyme [Oscillatoriales cyanobacterium SM2_2_1]
MDQTQVPLLAIARHYLTYDHAAFYMPGHKGGQGIAPELREVLGVRPFQLDLPELPDIALAIAEAEALAASAYGAERTWFLVNGSTVGIQALVMATVGAGERILVGRNCHRATISALVLSGAIPTYLPTDYDWARDLDLGVAPHTLAAALEQYPDAKAVLLVSPNYFGVCGDLPALGAIAHRSNIPLLVDGAHGAHLGFHPQLPISALRAGADAVVHSTHKVGTACTQASMVHCQGPRLDPHRLQQAVSLLQTTSPNFLLLLSLDVSRWQLHQQGEFLLSQTLELAAIARSKLAVVPHLEVIMPQELPTLDPTRLTVLLHRLGRNGFEVDQDLFTHHRVMPEMPTLTQLVFILSIGTTAPDIQRLVAGLSQLVPQPEPLPHIRPCPIPPQGCSPREAFMDAQEGVPVAQAIGRISAELLCPYPPGIPVICPGERVTAEVIATLQQIHRAGGIIHGCSDPGLTTLRVLRTAV